MRKSAAQPVDHPGTFIVEELEARNWQQTDLAYILDMSPQQLNPLLNGKANISPDLAAALGEAFDMPAEFFANLQKMYDLSKAKPVDPGVKTRSSWLSVFPIREMIKRGWIEESEPGLLDLQMLRFFGKNRIDDIPFVGSGTVIPHASKKSAYEETTPIQYAWLHRVIKIAQAVDAPAYSESALRECLPEIRAHMLDKDDLCKIPGILLRCGVRLIFVEALAGSKIDGVCIWLEGQPAIGMTMRMDRLDNFCFVLRHELEHVLRQDGKTETFTPIDEYDPKFESNNELPDIERIANEAAAEFCVPRKLLESFILRKSPYISEKDVLGFAARIEIHPAVVIGQIQHQTKKYGWLRKYQGSIKDYLFNWSFKDGWGFFSPTGL